jgi:hypothetical protein
VTSTKAENLETEMVDRWDGFNRVSVAVRRPNIREFFLNLAVSVVGWTAGAIGLYLLVKPSWDPLPTIIGGVIGATLSSLIWFWRGRVPIEREPR